LKIKTESLVEQTPVPDVVDAQKPEIPVQQIIAPDVVDALVQQIDSYLRSCICF
jgi:hypothetical protein